MNRQNKGSLTEKQMGYLLIFPALLIILVIAIWPVMRSFWISLHDIRLNDPTKTEIHSSYGLDMERYVSTLPNLLRYVKKEAETAEGATKERLDAVRQQIEQRPSRQPGKGPDQRIGKAGGSEGHLADHRQVSGVELRAP